MTAQDLSAMPLHTLGKVNDSTAALRVPGGWVYMTMIGSSGVGVFVPEPPAGDVVHEQPDPPAEDKEGGSTCQKNQR